MVFGRPFIKWFAVCYGTVVCLSLCNVVVLWANGWMDQDNPEYGGRPRSRRNYVRWKPSSPRDMGTAAPTFRPMSTVAKQLDGSGYQLVRRQNKPRPRRHCVRWGPPTEKGTAAPTLRPMTIVAERSPISATAELIFMSRSWLSLNICMFRLGCVCSCLTISRVS